MAIRPNPLTPDYGWNDRAGRYVGANGRFVKFETVRDALDVVADASRANMTAISQQLQAGNITLAEWQTQMARELKVMHTAAAASANGGWAQMNQSDWGATGQMIRRQYEYLQGFANDIASGKQPLNGRFLVRAQMYADAPRSTFEQMRRRYEANRNGQTVEKRVLGYAEHCGDCVEYAGRGWQPIGTLPPIGASVCRVKCKCKFVYGVVGPDGRIIAQTY